MIRIGGSGIFLAAVSIFLAHPLSAGVKGARFEGTVSGTLKHNGASTQFVFTRKENQLRVEMADKSAPEPINIVDLAAKRLTIIYPSNFTFVHVDLIPPRRDQEFVVPSPPPMPSISQLPNNPAAGMPAMPMMPSMPAMPDSSGPLALKKTEKTRKILGLECVCYTVADRGETFEIWAVPDSTLFPFRLLQRNYNERHFGPQMAEDRWSELLQKQLLFPLEATLRMEPGATEQLSFKIDKIDRKKIDHPEELFSVPPNYYEIVATP